MPGEVAGSAVGIHLGRGNARGHWIAQVTYGGLAVDHLLLEYDERGDSLAPLRFRPRDSDVALGLATTKHLRLKDEDVLERRTDEASRYGDPDRFAASPASSRAT